MSYYYIPIDYCIGNVVNYNFQNYNGNFHTHNKTNVFCANLISKFNV